MCFDVNIKTGSLWGRFFVKNLPVEIISADLYYFCDLNGLSENINPDLYEKDSKSCLPVFNAVADIVKG